MTTENHDARNHVEYSQAIISTTRGALSDYIDENEQSPAANVLFLAMWALDRAHDELDKAVEQLQREKVGTGPKVAG